MVRAAGCPQTPQMPSHKGMKFPARLLPFLSPDTGDLGIPGTDPDQFSLPSLARVRRLEYPFPPFAQGCQCRSFSSWLGLASRATEKGESP